MLSCLSNSNRLVCLHLATYTVRHHALFSKTDSGWFTVITSYNVVLFLIYTWSEVMNPTAWPCFMSYITGSLVHGSATNSTLSPLPPGRNISNVLVDRTGAWAVRHTSHNYLLCITLGNSQLSTPTAHSHSIPSPVNRKA